MTFKKIRQAVAYLVVGVGVRRAFAPPGNWA